MIESFDYATWIWYNFIKHVSVFKDKIHQQFL